MASDVRPSKFAQRRALITAALLGERTTRLKWTARRGLKRGEWPPTDCFQARDMLGDARSRAGKCRRIWMQGFLMQNLRPVVFNYGACVHDRGAITNR